MKWLIIFWRLKKSIDAVSRNFSIYEEQKKLRDAFELAENEKIKKEVNRLKETARKSGMVDEP